jgi:hypothetical protein
MSTVASLEQRIESLNAEIAAAKAELVQQLLEQAGITLRSTVVVVKDRRYLTERASLMSWRKGGISLYGKRIKKDGSISDIITELYSDWTIE